VRVGGDAGLLGRGGDLFDAHLLLLCVVSKDATLS
jgi:hypothetical protein